MLKKFRYWFVNVYWYHYRLHTAAVLFAAILTAFAIHSVVTRVVPDVNLTLASDKPIGSPQADLLTAYWNETRGIVAGSSTLYLSEEEMLNWELLHVSFVDEERNLYIIGEGLREFFSQIPELFVPAAELGLPADPELPFLVPLAGSPVMDRAGLSGEAMFGLIKNPKEGSEADAKRRDIAAQCLRDVLNG
ncbi:MAG: hypothetical protein LBR72_02990 [Oscillospiraceae bacterium]|jgi:hypothetical protein|nr:hypothetical protein [Oscillospiraceae bacterium]